MKNPTPQVALEITASRVNNRNSHGATSEKNGRPTGHLAIFAYIYRSMIPAQVTRKSVKWGLPMGGKRTNILEYVDLEAANRTIELGAMD